MRGPACCQAGWKRQQAHRRQHASNPANSEKTRHPPAAYTGSRNFHTCPGGARSRTNDTPVAPMAVAAAPEWPAQLCQ
eukprot:8209224-Alexandrium_andersonii.AAC.1